MIFGEPAPTQADLRFSIFGIPVRVHPFFWLIAVLLGMRVPNAQALLIWVAAVFVGVLVHELGHAVVMRRFGFQPWITLYGLGGLASYQPGYGRRPPDTWGQVFISAAGPLAGFLMAAVIIALMAAAGVGVMWRIGAPTGVMAIPTDIFVNPTLTRVVFNLLFVTIVYGVLNLMPIYPLDGGQIARELFLRFNPRTGIHHSLMLSIVTAGGLALMMVLNGEIFLTVFFGFLAYSSFNMMQNYQAGGGWR